MFRLLYVVPESGYQTDNPVIRLVVQALAGIGGIQGFPADLSSFPRRARCRRPRPLVLVGDDRDGGAGAAVGACGPGQRFANLLG